MSLNKLTKKQLTKLNLDYSKPPQDLKEWHAFLELTSKTYEEFEKNRLLNENMTDVAMKEMSRLNEFIQQKAEKEIQLTEEKLEHVMQAVPALIAWTDNSGQIVGANENLLFTFSKNKNELIGHKFNCVGWDLLDSTIQYFLADPLDFFSTDLSLNLNNEERYYKIFFKKFNQNKMLALVGIDLTEDFKKQKELESAQAASMASSRMALLGEMAAGIAHEINNPLAIINLYTSAIEKLITEKKPQDVPSRLEKIKSTVMRISRIVSGLRSFARDADHDPFSQTSVNQIINETLELATQRLVSLNIELKKAEAPEDLKVSCRSTQISQVILNLISNATDAIEGFEKKWIEINYENHTNYVKIMVTDSGPGIPKNIQAKIFQPFFTMKEVGKGTGLGLSISIGIIESHNGKLYIDNDCSNTRFVIELPTEQPDLVKIKAAS